MTTTTTLSYASLNHLHAADYARCEARTALALVRERLQRSAIEGLPPHDLARVNAAVGAVDALALLLDAAVSPLEPLFSQARALEDCESATTVHDADIPF